MQIIEMGPWLHSAPGRYASAWTLQQLDRAVVDAFGFHALQLGLPELDGLRANRMPHRWLVAGESAVSATGDPAFEGPPLGAAVSLCGEFDALPFSEGSIDLVVMPHTLELAPDPHATLAEVARVLRPEGRVVIVGFNPTSLWGFRQWAGRGARLGTVQGGSAQAPAEAHAAEFLGYRRVRDWLRLLSFEIEGGRFGLWRPPISNARNLARMAWMDRVGAYWWPVLGGAYAIEAVKRVRGMRLVGLAPLRRQRSAPPQAVPARRQSARSTMSRLAQERSDADA